MENDFQKNINIIEVLNDWGYRVIEIDESFYVAEEFYPAVNGDVSREFNEISGQNITMWISQQSQLNGLDSRAKSSLINHLNNTPIRRRKYSQDAKWKDYLSQSAHNV